MKFTTLYQPRIAPRRPPASWLAGAAQAPDARPRFVSSAHRPSSPTARRLRKNIANVTGNPAPGHRKSHRHGRRHADFLRRCRRPNTADITGASRAMTESEWALCQENGVTEVTEAQMRLGRPLDRPVRGRRDASTLLSRKIFQSACRPKSRSMAKSSRTPTLAGAKSNSSLPDAEIVAFGPPPTSVYA